MMSAAGGISLFAYECLQIVVEPCHIVSFGYQRTAAADGVLVSHGK
jgi:hypothetical protein